MALHNRPVGIDGGSQGEGMPSGDNDLRGLSTTHGDPNVTVADPTIITTRYESGSPHVALLDSYPGTKIACLHPWQNYTGPRPQETGQRFVSIYDQNTQVQTLITQIGFQVTTGAPLPKELAWIIPVPTMPSKGDYGVVDSGIFEDMAALTRPQYTGPVMRGGSSVSYNTGLEMGEAVRVGPYDIQPVKAQGPEAAANLNAWLTENKFGAVPMENLKYYVDKGYTFLAVKVNGANRDGINSGQLPALSVKFKSPEGPVYPIKFSSHSGTNFDVQGWVVTNDAIPNVEGQAETAGFEAFVDRGDRFAQTRTLYAYPEMPKALQKLLPGWKQAHIYQLDGKNMNSVDKLISSLPSDLILRPLSKEGRQLSGVLNQAETLRAAGLGPSSQFSVEIEPDPDQVGSYRVLIPVRSPSEGGTYKYPMSAQEIAGISDNRGNAVSFLKKYSAASRGMAAVRDYYFEDALKMINRNLSVTIVPGKDGWPVVRFQIRDPRNWETQQVLTNSDSTPLEVPIGEVMANYNRDHNEIKAGLRGRLLQALSRIH